MIRVIAPARLHFGLLHVPVEGFTHWPDGTSVRQFGGVGLMIDGPQITVEAEPGSAWSASGPLAIRAMSFAKTLSPTPYRIHADGPAEHTGLGVGTALGLAVARAICGSGDSRELAARVGRGLRSGIGVYGFEHGGLIFDGGKVLANEPSSSVARLPFPGEWRILLARPAVSARWCGDAERQAFQRTRTAAAAANLTASLERIANTDLPNAARSADFRAFSDALYAFNRRAGEPFAADQGGVYAGPQVTAVVETLRAWGVRGVGQSSWGATVFAILPEEVEADNLALRLGREMPDLAGVLVTRANDTGAVASGRAGPT